MSPDEGCNEENSVIRANHDSLPCKRAGSSCDQIHHKAATWSNRTGFNDDRECRQDTAVNQEGGTSEMPIG
jgi:hypothetical protein